MACASDDSAEHAPASMCVRELARTCSAASYGWLKVRPPQMASRPSPAYDTVGDTSTPSAASTFPPAAATHLHVSTCAAVMRCHERSRLAVVHTSVPVAVP
jgi:hypothetical protein